jgi:2-polyprenyl-3-methyl-5-hydroxy-6-metoxy-1,4-benzoquinol methylase
MIDWTRLSDDPNNRAAKEEVRRYLLSVRRLHTEVGLLEFIERLVEGRSVLDVGVAAHAARYIEQDEWRHGRIARRARHCLGLDVIEPLVAELKSRGFNVVCADATSEQDLGERFELVFMGDVLEHVDSPVRLLRFAARHLAPGGRVYATTPNPFSRKFYRQFRRDGTAIVNLDHVCWVTPTQALELGRRAGLGLAAYHLVKPLKPRERALRSLAWKFLPLEWSCPDYIYEFA